MPHEGVVRVTLLRAALPALFLLGGGARSSEYAAGALVDAVLANVQGDKRSSRGFDGATSWGFVIHGLPAGEGQSCPAPDQLPLLLPSGFRPVSSRPYDCPIGQITHGVYAGRYLGRSCTLYIDLYRRGRPEDSKTRVTVRAHCPD